MTAMEIRYIELMFWDLWQKSRLRKTCAGGFSAEVKCGIKNKLFL